MAKRSQPELFQGELGFNSDFVDEPSGTEVRRRTQLKTCRV
jgi:hypothetical protein